MATLRYIVEARWDAEVHAYRATCPDIPGFVTEASTYDALVAHALDLIPELVDLREPVEIGVTMPVPRTDRILATP